jgi:hypothetical protein
MTNPFAIITLHAIDSLPKQLLIYTIGSTVLATFIYKSVIHITSRQNASSSSSSNFLSIFLKPFHYLFSKINDTTTPKETPFEDKYFNEYDAWLLQQSSLENKTIQPYDSETNTIIDRVEQSHKNECLENLYNSTVRETINDFYGDVIMCYDHATFSFAYYARTANIPYKYLETISRKYMIETNAPREIHVDIRNEYKKAKERIDTGAAPSCATASTSTAASTTASTTTSTDQDVFVKLKPYNTVSNLNLHTTTNDTTEKIHKFATSETESNNTSTSTSTSTSTKKIIREKANRYSYRGKISDFDNNHKRTHASAPASAPAPAPASAPASDTVGVKDYAEFKKLMMKTRSAL